MGAVASGSEKIRNLRLVLGDIAAPRHLNFVDAPGVRGGIAKGSVVELVGSAKVEWLLSFLKLHGEDQIFWCEKDQSVLPIAFEQRGVSLKRMTFGVFGDELRKPLRHILSSHLFQTVVAPNLFTDINTFKAFQLLSEKSNSTLFLLGGKTPSQAWPISVQLQIDRVESDQTRCDRVGLSSGLQVEILRQKHSQGRDKSSLGDVGMIHDL